MPLPLFLSNASTSYAEESEAEEEADTTISRPLRVVLIVGDPHTYYDKVQQRYKGFVYDLWAHVRDQLKTKHGYTFDETYVETANFTKVLQTYIRDRGYDMVIAPTSMLYERALYVEFSRPFGLNRHCVVVKKEIDWLRTMVWLFSYNFLPLMLLFVVVGLVIGWIMYRWNTDIEDIPAAVSAMVGNRDFLAQGTHTTYGSGRWFGFVATLFVLTVLSTFTLTFMGAFMTTKLMEAYEQETLTHDNIGRKTILCPTGYSVGKVMEAYGAKLVYKDGTEEALLKEFKETRKYDGVGLSYFDSLHRVKQFDLRISKTQFGMDKNGYALHPRHRARSLQRHVDAEIVAANATYVTADIFAKYLGTDNKYLGIL